MIAIEVVLVILIIAVVWLALLVKQERRSRRISDKLLAQVLMSNLDISDTEEEIMLFQIGRLSKNKWFDFSKD